MAISASKQFFTLYDIGWTGNRRGRGKVGWESGRGRNVVLVRRRYNWRGGIGKKGIG